MSNAIAVKNDYKDTFSTDNVKFVSAINETKTSEVDKLFRITSMTIRSMANDKFKSRCYLGINDIDRIKEALENYRSQDLTTNSFKAQIINDLSDFQDKILTNRIAKLKKLRNEKIMLEKCARDLNTAKSKIVADRLAKIQWPYNEVTKQIDSKIAVVDIRVARCKQQLENLKNSKPVAEEKDVILYQMELKEKYSVK